jgi:hypothetical protein
MIDNVNEVISFLFKGIYQLKKTKFKKRRSASTRRLSIEQREIVSSEAAN